MKKLLSIAVILGFTHFLLFGSGIGNNRNKSTILKQSTTLSLKMSQCVNTTSSITETACSSYTAPDGVVYTTSGVKTAIIPNAGGCDSIITINLTVTTITPLFTILDSICNGATPPILPSTSNNGITGTWSPSVVSNTATGTYVFTPSAGQCADDAIITKVVHVNQGLTVSEMNVHSNSPVCVGTTLNLYASGGVNYAWSGPNVFTSVNQNLVLPNAQVHFSGYYTVTVTTAEGCSSTATAIVVVNPLPTPAAFNNGPLCEGSTLNLTATGGLSYVWSGPNGYTNNLQNPTITNITTANSGNYTVTVSNSGGCNSSTQTNVVINPSVSSTTDIAICPSALPIIWNGLTFTSAGSQTATLVSSKGCDSLATLNLTVTPTMYTPIFTILDSICTGSTPPILPTTSNNGITGTWSPSVVSNTTTGSYTFTPTAGQCANNTPIIVVVRVNQVPTVAQMNVSSNSPICAGSTLNLFSNGGGGSDPYEWSGPAGYVTTFQNPTRANATVGMSGNYVVTVTTAAGCSSTAIIPVVVNPLPNATASNNGPICSGGTLNLTSGGGFGYLWSGPSGYDNLTQNPSITSVTTANAGVYSVTVTGTGGCTSSSQTNVVINPSVSSTTDIAICPSALPYVWNGLTFTSAGSQTATLVSSKGCDSLATLNLAVNPTSTSNNPISICMGDSYVFNGHTYTTTGIYNDTLQTTHGCDSIVTTNLTVNTSSITGSVVYSGGLLNAGTASVILFNEDVSGNFQQIDSVIVGSNGSFAFQNIPDGNYHLYVNLTDNSTYPDLFNTYLDSTIEWQNAAVLTLNCNTDTNVIIHMVETDPTNLGNGHITGTIQQYTNNKTIGDPLPGVEIYVRTESNNEPVANCASKSNGVYEFTDIPIGIYSIYVDIPGIQMIQTHTGINVTASDTLFGNLNFYVDTTTLSAGVYTNEILSVSKIETPELSVNIFPNPVKNELSIEVSNQTEGLSIEVLDINGKSLYKSTTGNRAKIEMNAFATGVYLIKIQSKNTVIFKKIIKE